MNEPHVTDEVTAAGVKFMNDLAHCTEQFAVSLFVAGASTTHVDRAITWMMLNFAALQAIMRAKANGKEPSPAEWAKAADAAFASSTLDAARGGTFN